MAALDFPPSPVVGDKYPVTPVPGTPQYTWDGEKWTTTGAQVTSASPSNNLPLMDATPAVPGVGTQYSREDHVHPTDTSRAADTAVLKKVSQSLTVTEQTDVRKNVYAAPFDALGWSGMQINGNAVVSQEVGTAGVSFTANGSLRPCDAWQVVVNQTAGAVSFLALQQATGGPPGHPSYLKLNANNSNFTAATTGDQVYLRQLIEGYRVARLGWGAAGASPLSYGMQFYSPVVGTMFVRLANGAGNRLYYQEHAVVVGWNWLTATIPGDTSGTWVIDNGGGLYFDIFVGGKETAPATTGSWGTTLKVQTTNSTNLMGTAGNAVGVTGLVVLPGIEAPSAARSPLIMRPFDQELITCQRYWQKSYPYPTAPGAVNYPQNSIHGIAITPITIATNFAFKTRMRATPTLVFYAYSGNAGVWSATATNGDTAGVSAGVFSGDANLGIVASTGGLVQGAGYYGHFTADARL